METTIGGQAQRGTARWAFALAPLLACAGPAALRDGMTRTVPEPPPLAPAPAIAVPAPVVADAALPPADCTPRTRPAAERAPVANPSPAATEAAPIAARAPAAARAPLAKPSSAPAAAAPIPPPAPATGVPGLPELAVELDQLRADFDLPIEVTAEVVHWIRRFQAPDARFGFAQWLARSQRYGPPLRAILREEGVPEDLIYLAMVESGFSTHATSRARAVGTWQFLAPTARQWGLRQDSWVDERRDPEKAARAAARFLRALHDQTGDWHLAIASYNAGPGRIRRAMRQGYGSFWEMARRPGVLPRETRAYVPRVLAAAIIAHHPEAFGFAAEPRGAQAWGEYDVVTVPAAISLRRVSAQAAVSLESLRELNPELRTGFTPPRRYALRIPRTRSTVAALETIVVPGRRAGAADRSPAFRPPCGAATARSFVRASCEGSAGGGTSTRPTATPPQPTATSVSGGYGDAASSRPVKA